MRRRKINRKIVMILFFILSISITFTNVYAEFVPDIDVNKIENQTIIQENSNSSNSNIVIDEEESEEKNVLKRITVVITVVVSGLSIMYIYHVYEHKNNNPS